MVADSQERTIRVLYLAGKLSASGRRAILLLASRLPRRRFETVVACEADQIWIEALQRRGVTVAPLQRSAGFAVDAVLSSAREIRRHRAHVVHLSGCAGPAAAAAARLARVPAVVCSHDTAADDSFPRSSWQRLGRRLLFRAADRLVDRHVAMSRWDVRALADDCGVDPARIRMIPLGIDLEQFAPEHGRPGTWRRPVGVATDATLICALLGRDPEASGALALRMLRSLKLPEGWVGVVLGAGSSRDELEARARSLELGGRVWFADPAEATRELLADADIVLALGSGGDSLGIREAMAMARPVVALESEDAADAISDGVDGRLVARGDAAALADAISNLVSDRAAAERIGRNGRRKAEREFSAERMVRRAGILYEEVLRGKRSVASASFEEVGDGR